MTDKEKLQQTLEMLIMLSSGIRYRAAEIAERFNISKRSVYRNLNTFKNVGFVFDPDHRNGYYSIDKNLSANKALNDLLHFSEEEAWILNKAIFSIQCDNLLKNNLLRKLYALYDFERVADAVVKEGLADTIHTLYQAMKHKREVILNNYRSSNSSTMRNRLVEPYTFNNGYQSFWAYEPSSRSNKVFKTERVGKVLLTGNTWSHERYHHLAEMDIFRVSGHKRFGVKMILSMRAGNLLVEEYPLAEKYLKPFGDQNFLFDGWVCSFDGIGRFVAGLADEVQIWEPDSLRTFVVHKLKTGINHHGQSK